MAKRVKDVKLLHEKLCTKFKKMTKHEFVHFVDRGNTALFIALHIAKEVNPRKLVAVVDQGGWYSYKTYPKYFGFSIKEVETDFGVIDAKKIGKELNEVSALIVPSFAGYFAEQELRRISSICRKKGCLLIEDATGSVGDRKLCNGKYSDILIGSFDRDSVIGYGYGGFISVGKKAYFDICRQVFSLTKVHPRFYSEIMKYIRKNKFKKLLKLAEIVKGQLKGFDIVHKERRGLNVVVKYSPDAVDFCKRNGFPYLLCPKYSRVNLPAVCIELCRLKREEIDKLILEL